MGIREDILHLQAFLSEYKLAGMGYLVCQVPWRAKLAEGMVDLPWREVDGLVL
jgi:hypothetical protein